MANEFDDFKDVDPSVEMDENFTDVDPGKEMDSEFSTGEAKAREDFVVEKYQKEEEMMVLIFSQWCVNNGFDPVVLYEEAYPRQGKNDVLYHAVGQTVSREESDVIPLELITQVLQAFGNDDLIFVMHEKLKEGAKRSTN